MKRKIIAALLSLSMGLSLVACADTGSVDESAAEPVTLTVLAAASLTDVMGEIETAYETSHPNVDLVFSFASSGDLQAQIENGAPADVFISAAAKQMNALNEEGLMNSDSIIDLLQNKVVLIVPADSTIGLASFEDVLSDEVTMIGLGEPESVPAGKYAQQIFETLGIWEDVQARANLGTDVRTVLSWVEAGEVSCGVVYATDAFTTDLVTIVAEAPEGSCDDVIYPAGIVAASANADASAEFIAYLQGADAAASFESYGFTMVG